MAHALRAGAAYFALVFAAGFALAVPRELLLTPLWGKTGAIVAELPVILSLSWWLSLRIARRTPVPAHPVPRLVMGSFAFALLMAGETGLAYLLSQPPPAETILRAPTAAGLVGLAGQIVFALIPWMQCLVGANTRS